MKKFFNSQMVLALILIALSVTFYFIHYLIFRNLHHIFFYLITDIAFLFLNVLIVMLVFERLLAFRDKQSILKKLNMVVGAFFSEAGTELLYLVGRVPLVAELLVAQQPPGGLAVGIGLHGRQHQLKGQGRSADAHRSAADTSGPVEGGAPSLARGSGQNR